MEELCEKYNLKYGIMYYRITKLEIPFEVAIKMSGFQKVMYKGKETDLRHVSRKENLPYNDLLKLVLAENKDIETAISELGGKK